MLALLALSFGLLSPIQEPADGEFEALTVEFERLLTKKGNGPKRRTTLHRIGMLDTEDAARWLADRFDGLPEGLKKHAVHALSLAPSSSIASKELHRFARKSKGAVQQQAIQCLGHLGGEEHAWLRKEWLSFDDSMRPFTLQVLLDNKAEKLDPLIRRACEDDLPKVRAIGIRGIGELRVSKGFSILTEAVTDRARNVRIAAFQALGEWGGKEGFRVLINSLDDVRNQHLTEDVIRALSSADEASEVSILVRSLNSRDSNFVERVLQALSAAAHHVPEKSGPALLRMVSHADPLVRSAAIEGCVVARPNGVQKAIVRALHQRHVGTRTDALWALSILGDIPESVHEKILDLCTHHDQVLRLHATACLQWIDSPASTAASLENLKDDWWAVRTTAVESLLSHRQESSYLSLVDLGLQESGRVKDDVVRTLALLTGVDFGGNLFAWKSWWADRAEGYSFPSSKAAQILLDEYRKNKATISDTGYHGVAIPAGGVVFVLDISGSMNSRFNQTESYLTHFSKALQSTLKALPAGQKFGIIVFGSGVQAWKNELVLASPEHVNAACNYLNNITTSGATNFYDALEMALLMEGVQTVFALTDGQPTAGKRVATADILNGIRRLNRDHKVRIHTIAAGGAAIDFLAELATQGGGQAVDLTGMNR